jgi:hypothetical protein
VASIAGSTASGIFSDFPLELLTQPRSTEVEALMPLASFVSLTDDETLLHRWSQQWLSTIETDQPALVTRPEKGRRRLPVVSW